MNKQVTRTVTVNDLTPEELASLFCQLCNDEQARFLTAVCREAMDWPGTGWDGQAAAIAQKSDAEGRSVIGSLAYHMCISDDRDLGPVT